MRRFLCFLCFSAKDSADDAEHMDDDYEAYRMKQVHALTHFLVNKVREKKKRQDKGGGVTFLIPLACLHVGRACR